MCGLLLHHAHINYCGKPVLAFGLIFYSHLSYTNHVSQLHHAHIHSWGKPVLSVLQKGWASCLGNLIHHAKLWEPLFTSNQMCLPTQYIYTQRDQAVIVSSTH